MKSVFNRKIKVKNILGANARETKWNDIHAFNWEIHEENENILNNSLPRFGSAVEVCVLTKKNLQPYSGVLLRNP